MYSTMILVFLGGAFGAMVREFIMLLIPSMHNGFPLDILVANVIAAFLLGLATAHHRLQNLSDDVILLFGTGALGGMSTFSSFAYGVAHESMQPGGMLVSLCYVIISLVLGFIAVWLGLTMANRLSNSKQPPNSPQ
ncbi:MAG: CrcB family protein [Shewanella sp.]|uniref:CrcB family protein n=1 Tax=Shewanella sp. SNU WT4 TaxID=2590015 RepID=UPI00112B683D|nr:CrcB family protein [Shewanella sp. SNU WT4]QDF66110.1 fluoride ion transporter CrcB [Shewanella sp. SNU WT4]